MSKYTYRDAMPRGGHVPMEGPLDTPEKAKAYVELQYEYGLITKGELDESLITIVSEFSDYQVWGNIFPIEIYNELRPNNPQEGPPLPRGLGIRWPWRK